jgi:hypothetical protein
MNSISTNIEGGFNAGLQPRAMPQLLSRSYLWVKGIIFDRLEYTSGIFGEEDFGWKDGVTQDSKTVHKWKEILSHIRLSSSRVLSGKDDSILGREFKVLYCGSTSGYGTDADAHVAAFILSRIVLTEAEVSLGLIEFLEGKSIGGDSRLIESDCQISQGLRFAISLGGFYALIPPCAREGDLLCIIFGASTPFIIRPVPVSDSHYQLVGETFVSGAMEGEIVKGFRGGDFVEKDIIIV